MACKLVKYCSRECQIAHRPQHKKECRKRAAELHDEKLFEQPPPTEDCPICFERLPYLNTGSSYYSCCGKVLCSGCIDAPLYDDQGNKLDNEKCPFCRVPWPESEEEAVERLKERMEIRDPMAIFNMGCYYRVGVNGFPRDYTKALELWHQAADLGCAGAYNNIGCAYDIGEGVEVDKKKAKHYLELAAMAGDVAARNNLAVNEVRTGNMDRALKHWIIAVKGGKKKSLDSIKWLYSNGHARKDDYANALQAYQAYIEEIKSVERDEAAAAASERWRYLLD